MRENWIVAGGGILVEAVGEVEKVVGEARGQGKRKRAGDVRE